MLLRRLNRYAAPSTKRKDENTVMVWGAAAANAHYNANLSQDYKEFLFLDHLDFGKLVLLYGAVDRHVLFQEDREDEEEKQEESVLLFRFHSLEQFWEREPLVATFPHQYPYLW